MEIKNLMALTAFCTGLFTAWVCICRLNSVNAKVLTSVRFKYVMLLVGSLAYGSQPMLFGQFPTYAGLFFQLCVVAGLVAGYKRWQSGPPPETMIDQDNAKFSRR